MKIGIDIGRVLMCPIDDNGEPDTSFLNGTEAECLLVPAAPLALLVISMLWAKTKGNVWLVSKARERTEALTRKWLNQNFYQHTGSFSDARMTEDNVIFCRARPEKAVICQKLGIDTFIDDRLDVLEPMRGIVPNLYLFGVQTTTIPTWVTHVLNWLDVQKELVR